MPMSDYMKKIRSLVGKELLVLPSVTIIHFDAQDRMLLMQHRGTGQWVAPGGAIEPNEFPADAAVREMWEETGLHVELTGILGVFGGPECLVTYPNGDQTSYVMTVYGCQQIGGHLHPNDGEALDLRYFAADEISDLQLAPWAITVLPQLFATRETTILQAPTWTPDTA